MLPAKSDLDSARRRLKRVEQPTQRGFPKTVGEELSEKKEQEVMRNFFDAGLENWLPLLGDLTFPSASVSLNRSTCQEIFEKHASDSNWSVLEENIDAKMKEFGWDRIFVKLSTRSPKDSPLILARAAKEFREQGGPEMQDLSSRIVLLAGLVQQNFSVGSGREAVELLLSSDRVREDIEYALKAPRFEDLGLHVVMRKWEEAIPIAQEFRGIVWEGSMNAIGQYYHPLVFEQILGKKCEIEADLRAVHDELQPTLTKSGFTNYIIDFSWMGPGRVTVIELNPFDGVVNGCFPGSTGLFHG